MLQQYELGDTIRRNATFCTPGTYYSYICIADGGYTYDGATSCIKKGVPGGPDDDNDGYIQSMNSPLNTYILRLADGRDQGRIPYIQLGGKILYRQSDIEKAPRKILRGFDSSRRLPIFTSRLQLTIFGTCLLYTSYLLPPNRRQIPLFSFAKKATIKSRLIMRSQKIN